MRRFQTEGRTLDCGPPSFFPAVSGSRAVSPPGDARLLAHGCVGRTRDRLPHTRSTSIVRKSPVGPCVGVCSGAGRLCCIGACHRIRGGRSARHRAREVDLGNRAGERVGSIAPRHSINLMRTISIVATDLAAYIGQRSNAASPGRAVCFLDVSSLNLAAPPCAAISLTPGITRGQAARASSEPTAPAQVRLRRCQVTARIEVALTGRTAACPHATGPSSGTFPVGAHWEIRTNYSFVEIKA
jgi:hypothetical protein